MEQPRAAPARRGSPSHSADGSGCQSARRLFGPPQGSSTLTAGSSSCRQACAPARLSEWLLDFPFLAQSSCQTEDSTAPSPKTTAADRPPQLDPGHRLGRPRDEKVRDRSQPTRPVISAQNSVIWSPARRGLVRRLRAGRPSRDSASDALPASARSRAHPRSEAARRPFSGR